MILARIVLVACVAGLAACGGKKNLACDEGPYQSAVNAPRVEVPEDLDKLEPLREMPLPAASPRADRSADAPCLDRPPSVSTEISR